MADTTTPCQEISGLSVVNESVATPARLTPRRIGRIGLGITRTWRAGHPCHGRSCRWGLSTGRRACRTRGGIAMLLKAEAWHAGVLAGIGHMAACGDALAGRIWPRDMESDPMDISAGGLAAGDCRAVVDTTS